MIEISGFYFDGKTASRTAVTIHFLESAKMQIEGEDLIVEAYLSAVKISPRIANTSRNIYFTDGAKIESLANDEIDQVIRDFNLEGGLAWIHKLEKKIHYVIAAFFITIFSIWAGIEYGVPFTAKWAAKSIPLSVEQKIGSEGLETLDKLLLNPSKLDLAIQQRLTQQFQENIGFLENSETYQLVFRHSEPLGANALALPGGIIIVTDGLVELADNDQQIIAVLAHEVGHIIAHHGIRSVFQDSFTALLMAGVLGDLSSMSSLAVALPTILVDMRYSRQFEREADDYALAFLRKNDINPQVFAQILARLQTTLPEDSEFDYLSSHPAMAERIKRIDDAVID